jgi:cytochrome c-type protein NapC
MTTVLSYAALGCAALAAVILLAFLRSRRPVDGTTKVLLLVGIGVLPLGAAVSGNLAGLEQMKERRFCGSCHEMTPYTRDAADPLSMSTAAVHSRNAHFGEQSCFTCHKDYSMYGGIVTKLDGLKHVWVHYAKGGPTGKLKTYRPYQNALCQRCHSTTAPAYLKVDPHRETLENIRGGGVSCVGAACHGPVHDTHRTSAAVPAPDGAPPAGSPEPRTP